MNIFTGDDVFAVEFIHHGLDFTTTVEKTQTMVSGGGKQGGNLDFLGNKWNPGKVVDLNTGY